MRRNFDGMSVAAMAPPMHRSLPASTAALIVPTLALCGLVVNPAIVFAESSIAFCQPSSCEEPRTATSPGSPCGAGAVCASISCLDNADAAADADATPGWGSFLRCVSNTECSDGQWMKCEGKTDGEACAEGRTCVPVRCTTFGESKLACSYTDAGAGRGDAGGGADGGDAGDAAAASVDDADGCAVGNRGPTGSVLAATASVGLFLLFSRRRKGAGRRSR